MKFNQKGFGIVEILVIIVVMGVLGTVGWLAYDRLANKAPTTSNTQKETPKQEAKKADPYEGWKTYTLKYEKFSFKYPDTYTIEDKSAANPYVVPGSDWLRLSKSNGFVIAIQTGLFGIGGSCENCKIAQSKEISFLGKTAYLNFRDAGTGTIGMVLIAANNTDTFGASLKDRNAKSKDGALLPMGINLHYESDGSLVEKPLQTMNTSDDIAEAIKILESASY